MSLTTEVDTKAAMARLRGLPPQVQARVAAVTAEASRMLWDAVQANLSGAVLTPRSGRLLASIQQDTGTSSDGTIGRVFSDGSVPYAGIQEYGGRVAIPGIHPRSVKALAFPFEGKLAFAKHTRAHAVEIPEHSFLRAALADIAPWFQAALQDALREVTA